MGETRLLDLNTIAVNSRETIQFNNSTVFYSLVNSAFLPYYQRVVRKSQQWLDGYDPQFHQLDIFSSRIAEKIINGLARATFGKGLLFKKGKNNTNTNYDALNFVSTWADDVKLNYVIKNLIAYTEALGTACLKVNKNKEGKLWVEAQRLDYFYFSVDGRKEITSYTGFIRCFQTTETDKDNYFLVEKRYYKNEPITFEKEINGVKHTFTEGYERVPYVEYSVHVYRGMVSNNTMPSASASKSSINYKSLPSDVKDALKSDFGFLKIDEPQRLPFKNWLGVELFFNEGGDITNPTLPFGRSLVFSNLTDFIEYDLERSYAIRDLYNSKGIVGVPRSLTQSGLIGHEVEGTGGNVTGYQGLSAFGSLNIPSYEFVPGLDPESQKPIISQFEIRAVEHEQKQNSIIRSIALNIGVSPKILASYLVGGTQQTDDQIQSEDNSVIQWVKSHRQDFISGINRVIENVLNHEGIADNVSVSFASDDLLKEDVLLASIEKRMSLNLLDIDDAIRELYPDLDEEQLQVKIGKAKFLKEQNEQQMTDLDPFAGLMDEQEN